MMKTLLYCILLSFASPNESLIREKIETMDCDYWMVRNDAQKWLESNIDEAFVYVRQYYFARPIKSWEVFYRCENLLSYYMRKNASETDWTIFDLRNALNKKYPKSMDLIEHRFERQLDGVCRWFTRRITNFRANGALDGPYSVIYSHSSDIIRQDLLMLGVGVKHLDKLNQFVKTNAPQTYIREDDFEE